MWKWLTSWLTGQTLLALTLNKSEGLRGVTLKRVGEAYTTKTRACLYTTTTLLLCRGQLALIGFGGANEHNESVEVVSALI